MVRGIETMIIGGGQAGLSVCYYLSQAGKEHILVEKADRPAHVWTSDRWDSFTLVTPNWAFCLPGAQYDGPDPVGFMLRSEVIERFDRYSAQINPPAQFGVEATAVDPHERGFRVRTSAGEWQARNVVVATGTQQIPKIPPFSTHLPASMVQLHTGQYRNPQALPPGAVLIVGSGQSGCQIAEELRQFGRDVYLCVGRAGRVPRRYRGRDCFSWLAETGYLSRTVANLPNPAMRLMGNPQWSGKDGGHSINPHLLYREGVRLLGRLVGFEEGRLVFGPDLKDNLSANDQYETMIVQMIDDYIVKNGIDAPEEALPTLRDGYAAPEFLYLDPKEAGITSVIWAMGNGFDFGFVHAPVFDPMGFPIAPRGISEIPGLFFAGLSWVDTFKAGILFGVGEIARAIAEQIVSPA
ncbi:MAG TPA: NAD(P)-binding domain-containing protein [Anaerolineaceae bacterium]|nr:NAD(P)-binding domain-containing protein [Anaerolineaceae bacterium]